jgi:hypothetical protein
LVSVKLCRREVAPLVDQTFASASAVKQRIRSMLGFGSFRCTCIILGSIETMRIFAKGQMKHAGKVKASASSQLYLLAK